MAISIPRKLFTIEEYERMIEAGVFEECAHVELIESEIIEMSPLNPTHGLRNTVECITQQISRR